MITKRADALMDKYILPMGHPADARLAESGVSVWAIVALLRLEDGDREKVRDAYDLMPEELDAALAYYAQHRDVIDAQVLLNAAA